ncbi:hypothetical protein Goshw_021341 [Gossypium schwendimanii]|uniref:RNase H type-1 domain-containing protein n=1 Tax=Gossypium schwendimanii TaxID=34291 RepID=A0A7J9ML48_GOSSC|nr:hypothetical protein [Gossypium schwendimanii]
MVVWEKAQTLGKDFRIFELNDPSVIPPTLKCKGWKKPLKHFIKINVDAVVLNGCVDYGVVARDVDGFVLTSSYSFAMKALDAVWAKLEALTMSLNLASKLKVSKLIMESDNANLINMVKNRDKDVTILGRCVKKECMALRNFESVHFNWIDQRSNEAADLLCKLPIKNRCNFYFNLDYALEIHNVMICDVIK